MSLDNIIVVLHRTQDSINIGGVVRGMKNMGLRRLRLVEPVAFEPEAVRRVAHRSDDLLDRMQIYADLDTALADTIYVVGSSEHRHSGRMVRSDLRMLAPELLARAASGPLALLFGPEDNGLDNAALDRCQVVVSLPTDPAYPSLNLAQAALLLFYELRLAGALPPLPAPPPEPPTTHELATLAGAAEAALHAITFFKCDNDRQIMRSLRNLLYRADPSHREVALLTAICREVIAYLARR